MVALKSSEAGAFIARPDPARPIALIYGPDAGLVRERAEALIRVSVDNPSDPFSLIRIDGDELSGNLFRLVEEANTIPMFGGRRAIWVKAGSRNIVPAVEAVINAPSPDCRVVIEAGELRKSSPLRAICEKAKNTVAIACYADDERDLATVVDDELKQAGLAIEPEARAALMPFLGGDRRATRAELRKLVLYVHGRGRITVDDVMAVVADASAVALDNLMDAAFAGKPADVESHFAKARGEGTAPGAIVSAALRHLSSLHRMRIAVESGQSVTGAVEGARPPIHFRRKNAIHASLQAWTAAKLSDAMQTLGDALLQTRLHANLADAIAHRTLMTLATAAKKRS